MRPILSYIPPLPPRRLLLLAALGLAACQPLAGPPAAAPISSASPVPAAVCSAPAAQTPALTEGPYFKANAPERASLLEANTTGQHLVVSGQVLDTDCQPVANARLDFWQADANGTYDNTGYTLRGYQLTDADGRYRLETIVPGLYPGRTEHIHVKIQLPSGAGLTTQLFFPGVANNAEDGIFDARLLLPVQPDGNGLTAIFDFVVAK